MEMSVVLWMERLVVLKMKRLVVLRMKDGGPVDGEVGGPEDELVDWALEERHFPHWGHTADLWASLSTV